MQSSRPSHLGEHIKGLHQETHEQKLSPGKDIEQLRLRDVK